jgi:heme-degrading monooxygenase HmoA
MIILVQHHVRDYDAWKRVFDEHRSIREKYGADGHVVLRSADDGNAVTTLNHFPSRERAEAFAKDPSLKEAMEKAGVDNVPTVTFLEEADNLDYTLPVAV